MIQVIDSHTGGEPTRVITEGGPDLGGGTLAERARLLEGEYADFIILHPTKGMMFLECKGGNITFNATEKKWYQNYKDC